MNICDSLLTNNQSLIPAFDLGTLLTSLVTKAKEYGSGFIIFIGIIMIVVASFKIGKGLMSQGKPNAQPINWFLCGGLILVGGVMAFGGFSSMSKISQSIGSTADDLTDEDNMFDAGSTVKTTGW